MAGHETAAELQNDDPPEMAVPPDITVFPALPITPQSGPLLPARASTVQVLRELDQLLTMDTLIYFAQAVVELFWLSFHFAYAQQIKPPLPASVSQISPEPPSQIPSQTPPKPSPRKSERSSKRQLVWKKPKRTGHKTPRPDTTSVCSAPAISAQSNQIVIYPSEGIPGTGPVAASHPTNSARVPALAESESRLPLVLPVAPPALLPSQTPQPAIPLSLAATTPSPSPLGPVLALGPQITSQLRETSPRRKPVPSRTHRSSAKFDRPSTNTSATQSQLIADTTSQHRGAEHHVAQTAPPAPTAVIIVKPVSHPLVRKSSSKFIRPPLASDNHKPKEVSTPPSQSSPQPRSPTPLTEQPIPAETPAQPTADRRPSPRPLVRKSSAKFIRPSTRQSEVLHTTPALVADPTPEPQSPEQSPPQEPLEQQVVETQPQSEDPPELVEPFPQRIVSYTKPVSFPPRPAIAIVQAAPSPEPSLPQPESSSIPEEEPILPSIPPFPELPSLLPSNPRLPPPPPAIPRFPSPAKTTEPIVSAPESIIASNELPEPCRIKVPRRRPVSMAAVASPSEVQPVMEQGWVVRPETAYQFPPPSSEATQSRPDWDPSHDDNIFSAKPHAAPKIAVSSTPSRQFSSRGSITSQSSSDSPPRNSSSERLPSPPGVMDLRKHVRAASNHSHHVPSPIPSPRARPRSAGSISSGSDYILPAFTFDNTHLRPGNAAALLSHAETLDLYRQNARKAVDNPATQYEFAIFMMDAARDAATDVSATTKPGQIKDLLKEGLSILRRLADRGYPQAQYYLADCYTNGIGSKHNTPDLEKAFPLFILAAKHGHIEASFRAALAYENAWGCRRDPLKALQFLRKAASANHPGAMLRLGKACLNAEFGIPSTQAVTLEGVNWLKRAAEAATPLYPNAPYELALLHEFGHKDVVFPDEAYALQLFSKASDLGNAEASYRLGEAYEYGRMGLPDDASLSIHYYSLAARLGNAPAMLSLCAWYMVGAEGVLDKSDEEAFAWAQRAAEAGLAKAEFATGYFLERGVGCRRDGLEAWKYYVKAAEHGDERAIARLKAGKEVNADRSLIASSAAAESERRSGSDGDDRGTSPTRARKFWKR